MDDIFDNLEKLIVGSFIFIVLVILMGQLFVFFGKKTQDNKEIYNHFITYRTYYPDKMVVTVDRVIEYPADNCTPRLGTYNNIYKVYLGTLTVAESPFPIEIVSHKVIKKE